MNAFSPVEAEDRLAAFMRRGTEMARESGLLRRLRATAGRSPFLFTMALVTVATAIYFFLLAAPIYTSEVQFAVRGKQSGGASPLLSALGGGATAGMTDGPLLQDYIGSQAMLDKLDGQVGLRREYEAFRLDPFHRLGRGATTRHFLDFYKSMVSVDADTLSGVLTLHVNGFSAASANNTAHAMLGLSEAYVNDISRQMLAEATRAAQHDVALAQQADLQARTAVSSFQARNGNLDPQTYGSTAGSAIFGVEATIGQLRAQLASLMTYSTATSPQVAQVRAQIADMQKQEAELKAKLVGQSNGQAIVNQLGSFQALVAKQGYADQHLTFMQGQLDTAASNAAQKQDFLVLVSGPNLPDAPTPRAWWGLATAMVIAAFVYAALRLAIASIRDHQM